MNHSKQQGNQQHTLPAWTEDYLGAAVQKSLKRVLLKQGPKWDQQETPWEWSMGEMEAGHKNDQRQDDDRRNEEQLNGSEEVVETKAQVVQCLTIDAMRRDHQRERQGNRNRERELVCADERKDHPFGDQTRDENRDDLPKRHCRSFILFNPVHPVKLTYRQPPSGFTSNLIGSPSICNVNLVPAPLECSA